MTPEQRVERALRGWITEAVIDPSKTASTEQLKAFLVDAICDAVTAERERCAKIAAKDDWCCMNQKCHEVVEKAIREGQG